MVRVLLVRHGESTWNAVRRWQGQADPPLSERGESQAKAAGRHASTVADFGGLISSTLSRARQTADLLAAALGLGVAGEEALVERAAGEWEGLTRVEIEQRFPGYLADGRRPVGYEPDESVVERAHAALLDHATRAAPGSALMAVTHGGVIHALERRHTDEWRRLDNLAGRWFALTDGDLVLDGDRVSLLPDAAPLPEPPDRFYT